uniref:Uncharacterized protein n=1 Tax=Podoviridae sp. ct2m58 TaxID=2827721 RepID=A0A8S5TLX2_9CAUD|nr:MAG TPA: hypothetical protein [Podoviridae sp. ct2m58]
MLRYSIRFSTALSRRLFPSLSMYCGLPLVSYDSKLLHEGTKNPHLVCSALSSHMFGNDNILYASGL